MNVFPSAVEQILPEFDGVGEFRITFSTEPSAMDEIKVELEPAQVGKARPVADLRSTRPPALTAEAG